MKPEPPEPPEGADGAEGAEFSEFFHTEDLPEKSKRGSHRGAIEASPLMARLLAPVTAVVVVVVVILLLIWINGGSSSNDQSPAAVGPGPGLAHSAPLVTPSSHPSKAPTPRPHPSSFLTSPSTAKAHSIKPTKAKPTNKAKPTAVTAMAPVTVLNNSRRTGLAAAVAAELRSHKWQVAAVGNQQAVIPVTTVYYAPGDHAAALHLEHDFSSVQRVATNRAGNVHGSALTLVVTQSWAL